ncbi:hypothetical protein EMIHUDRAFT_457032 [Emiliania huxleyi CCMP1516]|uniref:SMP-LTD domain-containing protein n=2 Tax=Emiliania huxleyi TaxID=2903 RepID=A0A0D3JXC5_EMIH1|nr:hypothetical protein EMIHUDRAFT_457032 [Emiliania huxleyi CCMP1516]EOD28160.1 hypothetical protein EMIHUDRAFT_457032 [Emiliania huxleyi CCMP1516]|eukprot:XP_005780589.1 hypothetical protein EMIHUDRAFT_457032 [Emiliania huxleyi CCMP1516]
MQANGVVKAVCSPKRSPSVGSVSSSDLANGDDQANGGETAVPARVSPAVHASLSAMPGHMPPAPGSPLAKAGPSADGEGKSLLGGTALELAALRQQVAMLESRLREADRTRQMWEACMTTLVGSILLGPEMNEMYKQECSSLLSQALVGLEQIDRVRYVECSFPSVSSEAPRLSLESWESIARSEWQLRWSPSWSMQVAVEGSYYVSFRLLLKIDSVRMSGALVVNAANDLRQIGLSFAELPALKMRVECTVSWGTLPLPLQDYIGETVVNEFRAWLTRAMVQPNELVIKPAAFQPKQTLTDADVERAMRAASMARELSEVQNETLL